MNGDTQKAIDLVVLALCAWRENRHGQIPGMQSVINCIMNRVKQRNQEAYYVITAPRQFSSMTAIGDAQLGLYPNQNDQQWSEALDLAAQGIAGTLADITGGATSYYALSMTSPPPYWAPSMTPTVVVAGQQFLK